MKNIKEYLNEGLIKRQAGANIKDKIRDWIDKYCDIKNEWLGEVDVVINNDLTIDVNNCGYIVISDRWKEKKLPDYIQFGYVRGDFYVGCKHLESLRGCPREVGEGFSCSFCKGLKNLEGAPKSVRMEFNCSYCESLENFVGAPEHVGQRFNAHGCKNLKSFEGIPKKLKLLDLQGSYLYNFPHPITQK